MEVPTHEVVSGILFTRQSRAGNHESGATITRRLVRPTRELEAGLPVLPYLALLHVGFTELPTSPPVLVGSYPTVAPLPPARRASNRRRYYFCGTSPRLPSLGVTQHAARGVPTFLHRKLRQRFPFLVGRKLELRETRGPHFRNLSATVAIAVGRPQHPR